MDNEFKGFRTHRDPEIVRDETTGTHILVYDECQLDLPMFTETENPEVQNLVQKERDWYRRPNPGMEFDKAFKEAMCRYRPTVEELKAKYNMNFDLPGHKSPVRMYDRMEPPRPCMIRNSVAPAPPEVPQEFLDQFVLEAQKLLDKNKK